MTGYLHTPTGPGMIADHERRLRELERALRPKQTDLAKTVPPAPGGGGYAATITIAATDATDASKSAADRVCDGSGDQVEINTALEECHDLYLANGVGGRVLLSEGNFHLDPPGVYVDAIAATRGTLLQGQGFASTSLHLHDPVGNSFIVQSYGERFALADLRLDGSDAIDGGLGAYIWGDYSRVDRVAFSNLGMQNWGNLDMRGYNARIADCHFDDMQGFSIAIFTGGNHAIVRNNLIRRPAYEGIHTDGRGSIVIGNVIQYSQVHWTSGNPDAIVVATASIVVGNFCEDNGTAVGPATISAGAGSQVGQNVLV